MRRNGLCEHEVECNELRKENQDLRKRLKKMQNTIKKYHEERRKLLKERGHKVGAYNKNSQNNNTNG